MASVVLFKDYDDQYCAVFEALGCQTQFVELLSFEFIHQSELHDKLSHPERYSGMVVTSKRGFEALKPFHNLLEMWKTMPVYCVGQRCGEAGRALALNTCGEECGQGAVLAHYILDHHKDSSLALLYLCAEEHRPELSAGLAGQIPLDILHVYRTHPLAPHQVLLPPSPPSWAVFFSPSGAKTALGVCGESWRQAGVRFAAIGRTTQTAMEALGMPVDAVAAVPSAEGVCGAVREWEERTKGGTV